MTGTPYRSFAKETITRHLEELIRHKKGIIKTADVECLHQARVASRRLRNALWVFKSLFPEDTSKLWHKRIKTVVKITGTARDLDIQVMFLDEIKRHAKAPLARAGIERLQNGLRRQRREMQTVIGKALRMLDSQMTLDQICAALKALKTKKSKRDNLRMIRAAQKKITKRLNGLLDYESYVTRPDRIRELHLMRIAAKRLRYTLEVFSPVAGENMDAYTEKAHTIQNLLGTLHDLDVWLESTTTMLAREKNAALVAGLRCIQQNCGARRNKAYKRFLAYWMRLKKQKTWDRLRAYVT